LTKWGLLDFKESDKGIEVSVNARELMKDHFQEFKDRLSEFRNSDDEGTVCEDIKDDLLVYQTESLHPKQKRPERIPLLFLFGNPAPHSVKKGMFFSYERDCKEHRFWKVLAESKIFEIYEQVDDLNIRNKLRKEKLLGTSYTSPFQIYLDVFYSMPSPATGKWSGVAGLKRLFGRNAFERISELEKKRVESMIKKHLSPNGVVLTFQKDAYDKIKSGSSPEYAREKAGRIEGNCEIVPEIKLYCLAPTRLMCKNLGLLEKLNETQ